MKRKTMPSRDTGTEINNTAVFSVALSSVLDVANIDTLFQRLKQALSSTKPTLLLNAEEVERVDGASLQLLAAFYREARVQGYTVRWNKPSVALQRSARLVGLGDWLGLSDAPVAHD